MYQMIYMAHFLTLNKGDIDMNTTVYFAKTKPNARIPSKRDEDAGFDIYACFDDDYIVIKPHETKLIPTGIVCACDKDYCLILKERGSTGVFGLAQRAGVIDSGYRGEIFVPLTNTSDSAIAILRNFEAKLNINWCEWGSCGHGKCYLYEKAIAQAIVVPVPRTEVKEITYDELQAISSERGDGALGSSGK